MQTRVRARALYISLYLYIVLCRNSISVASNHHLSSLFCYIFFHPLFNVITTLPLSFFFGIYLFLCVFVFEWDTEMVVITTVRTDQSCSTLLYD